MTMTRIQASTFGTWGIQTIQLLSSKIFIAEGFCQSPGVSKIHLLLYPQQKTRDVWSPTSRRESAFLSSQCMNLTKKSFGIRTCKGKLPPLISLATQISSPWTLRAKVLLAQLLRKSQFLTQFSQVCRLARSMHLSGSSQNVEQGLVLAVNSSLSTESVLKLFHRSRHRKRSLLSI